jgi:hypothetical protein
VSLRDAVVEDRFVGCLFPADATVWQVTDVTEEGFETTEVKEVDLLASLLELAGWEVNDKESIHTQLKDGDIVLMKLE